MDRLKLNWTNLEKHQIDPVKVLNEMDQAKREGRFKYFRVFNTRTGKDVFTLQTATVNYYQRDPKHIECLRRKEAATALFSLNEKLIRSNYLSFEVTREG